ncbi:hypothetical protein [Sphingomonas flavalba]|uniref:hypothetical protein n=1 Tax=Sphingomonas flavalba TaxID=2559804 RepID=UPI001446447D|nr:hypothetical protein [Sphingomonas flavalba]
MHSPAHFIGRRRATDVPILFLRVSADNEEIAADRQPAMVGADRQHQSIDGADFKLATAGAAEQQRAVACRHAKCFVRGRVIIVIILDRIAPLGQLSMIAEQLLDALCSFLALGFDRVAIEQDREPLVVPHPVIFVQDELFGAPERRLIGSSNKVGFGTTARSHDLTADVINRKENSRCRRPEQTKNPRRP